MWEFINNPFAKLKEYIGSRKQAIYIFAKKLIDIKKIDTKVIVSAGKDIPTKYENKQSIRLKNLL